MNNETINVENVEIDLETIRIAQDIGHTMMHKRLEAASDIIEAVIRAFSTEDRRKLEEYRNQ